MAGMGIISQRRRAERLMEEGRKMQGPALCPTCGTNVRTGGVEVRQTEIIARVFQARDRDPDGKLYEVSESNEGDVGDRSYFCATCGAEMYSVLINDVNHPVGTILS